MRLYCIIWHQDPNNRRELRKGRYWEDGKENYHLFTYETDLKVVKWRKGRTYKGKGIGGGGRDQIDMLRF